MLNSFAGNREVKETLRQVVDSGRFPHAFILEGEEGSGRHTLARIIAAAAICTGENAPCNTCRECELIKRDGHCDVLTYAPEGATFKIDTVREIRENAYIMPIEASRKVNIILDCDRMGEPAQNAFLKILEEPPKFMVFILVCRNASSLLTTVRSRCVTLRITNPEQEEAADYIALKTGKSEDDIKEALDATHGNIGKALAVLSGEASETAASAKEIFEAIVNRDRLAALKVFYKFEKDRIGCLLLLSELRQLFQREARLCALKESRLKTSAVSAVLTLLEETEITLKRHVGQPLSNSLTATALCSQIFAYI